MNCQLFDRNGIFVNGATEKFLSIWEWLHVTRSL